MPSHSLMNENKEMVDSTEEEDGEGYKCDDGNDNDNDFVNLEDEWWLIIEQNCYPSVFNDILKWWFWIVDKWHIFACWIIDNLIFFFFGNSGFGYALAIMMLSFYTWSSLFLCFLLIILEFWIIFGDICV